MVKDATTRPTIRSRKSDVGFLLRGLSGVGWIVMLGEKKRRELFERRNRSRSTKMFRQARSFNQPMNRWNAYDQAMFALAAAFNPPMDGWHARAIRTIRWMFREAILFNQSLIGSYGQQRLMMQWIG
jgi:hypothetical protein